MKKIFITFLALYGFTAMAQIKIGNNATTVNANAVLELESSNKGLLYPRIALTGTTSAAPLSAHVQGMTVYNTATTADVAPGLYVNDGTRWVTVMGTPASETLTAFCNGFTGSYSTGSSPRAYTVTLVNNRFTPAQVTPSIDDLILSPASGLSVASVSPSTATTINSEQTLAITYTLTGTLTASPGTVITGTFAKLGISCSETVSVANNAPVVSAGSAQSIPLPATTSVTLNGSANDTDGSIASYLWSRNGGTGTANITITSPTTASTSITGITSEGTYIFRLTATDNLGATSQASVTITAFSWSETATVAGNNGTTLTFMSHNLGVDTSLDPHNIVKEIHGNYYQWGRIAAVANADSTTGSISGWNTTNAAAGSWGAVKTANDPCPTGYRVPTDTEWSAAINAANGNTVTKVGTWSDNATNFLAAVRISNNNIIKMTLPAAGLRRNTSGALLTRGSAAYYWSSTVATNNAPYHLEVAGNNTVRYNTAAIGMSVRCIKE